MIHLGDIVWLFESGTAGEVIHLGQSVWCVESETVGDVTHLGRDCGFLKLGHLVN
jgi:hypothetical protein